jgi:alkanesulfonate monooxygenase SsuD/methylene tetrahydromethanopterin reductase-like flavin-dependent oxidoreductase (luciferase family)
MRFGLELPCGGEQATAEQLVALAVDAERAGWDGIFFEDYLVYYRGSDPPTFDPWVLLAAVAARTDRLWLGTTVSGLVARDPVKLAREAVTLDALAPGRVVLGVGVGDPADRGTQLGVWPAAGRSRGSEMDRRLGLLLRLLSGEPVEHAGGDGPVRFRPTTGSVRVWVGGSAEASAVARRAAVADGIVPYKLTDTSSWSDFTDAEIRRLVDQVAVHREPMMGFDVAIGGRPRLPDLDDEREAIDRARLGGATWWLEFVPPGDYQEMCEAVGAGPVRGSTVS